MLPDTRGSTNGAFGDGGGGEVEDGGGRTQGRLLARLGDEVDHRLELLALGVALLDVGERVLVLGVLPALPADVVVGAGLAMPPHSHDRVAVALVAPIARVHRHHLVQLAHHLFLALPASPRQLAAPLTCPYALPHAPRALPPPTPCKKVVAKVVDYGLAGSRQAFATLFASVARQQPCLEADDVLKELNDAVLSSKSPTPPTNSAPAAGRSAASLAAKLFVGAQGSEREGATAHCFSSRSGRLLQGYASHVYCLLYFLSVELHWFQLYRPHPLTHPAWLIQAYRL